MSTDRVPWPPVGVTQRRLELKELVSFVKSKVSDDASHHLARYLAVRSAGVIEAVRDDVADEYCRSVGPARLHRRVSSGLRYGQGVRPNQLVEFMRTFDTDWADELDSWLKANDARRSNDLGALVTSRHRVAHGDGERVTTSKALTWAACAIEVMDWLVKRFDPNSN